MILENIVTGVKVLTAQVARTHHLDANQMAAVRKAKERLLSEFPVESVKLFGSYSRGNATNESDIDLFVLTSRPLSYRERGKMVDQVFPINLEHDTLISLLIASKEEWESPIWSQLPVFADVRRDGTEI